MVLRTLPHPFFTLDADHLLHCIQQCCPRLVSRDTAYVGCDSHLSVLKHTTLRVRSGSASSQGLSNLSY